MKKLLFSFCHTLSYTGDILFRYCPVKYYPFDANNVDKYIVGDDYLPTWEVPSLAPYYNGLGFGMKDSFDAFLRKKGRDPKVVWEQVEDAIRIAVIEKESHIVNIVSSFIDSTMGPLKLKLKFLAAKAVQIEKEFLRNDAIRFDCR